MYKESEEYYLYCNGSYQAYFITTTIFKGNIKVCLLRIIEWSFAISRDKSSCGKINDMSQTPKRRG